MGGNLSFRKREIMSDSIQAFKNELKASLGQKKLTLRLDHVRLVNVCTEEIYPASIGIFGSRIAGIYSHDLLKEELPAAEKVIDGKNAYAVPGFIDGHVHIETTLLTPEALSEVIVPWGTTSLFVDAMEIANVAGIDGLKAMIKDADRLPFRIFLEIPSRVPTAPGLETTGGVLGVEEVKELLKLPETLSLGEMDPSKILDIRPEYLEKILAASDGRKICNGHAIGLTPKELNTYAAGHLSDDHESVTYEEMVNRLRVGVAPLIREGSSERNVEALVSGIVKHGMDTSDCMFCTDDKHVNDIYQEGHISYNIRKSISLGLPAVQAIRMATWNAAKHFRIEDRIGSISPGRFADIVLLKDLKKIKPVLVIKDGKIAADEKGAVPVRRKKYPAGLLNTVHISPKFSAADFRIPCEKPEAVCRVIEMIRDQIINREADLQMKAEDGELRQDLSRDILKLAVVERYGKNGNVGVGFVKGFGLKKGALASSVSHDHHNIVTVGTNDRDMEIAVKELNRIHGGFCLAADGKVIDSLPLPFGGLMSLEDSGTVMKRMNEMNAAVRKLGCGMAAPFMSLSFISLPTVPELGLTDQGLIDVLGHKKTNLIL
jgi:adenine deaminase